MIWAGLVARMGRKEIYKGFLYENLKNRGHLEYLGVDGRMMLRWILNKGKDVDWINLAQDRNK